MKPCVLLTVALAALMSMALTQPQQRSATQVQTSLDAAGKTGWITLGYLSPDLKRWIVLVDPNVDFFSGAFEILSRNADRHSTTLPEVGERIRLTVRNEVIILDYATRGEERYLEPPYSAKRPLGPEDRTGIVLPAGSTVEIRAMDVARGLYGGDRTVWARVSPAAASP